MTKTLNISPDLQLPLDVVTETFAFLARRNGGKTYSAGVLAEEMLANGLQVVVLDPVGKWWALRVAADGKSRGFDIPILGGPRGDAPLSEHSGELVAELAVRGYSMVLDLTHFDSDAAQRRFVTSFVRAFYRGKQRQDPPTPVHLMIEEAEEFVPQDFSKEDTQMIGAMKKLIKLGRNYGIGASLVSQRSADVNKKVLSQVGILVALQTLSPHDRKAIRSVIEGVGFEEVDELDKRLRTLKQGEAIFWDPGRGTYQIGRFRKKTTLDASKTPEQSARARVATPTLGESELASLRAAMDTVVKETEASDPRALKARIAVLERDLSRAQTIAAPAPAGYPKEALDAAYQNGASDGRRSATQAFAQALTRTRLDCDRIAKAIAAGSATLGGLHAEVTATLAAMGEHAGLLDALTLQEQAKDLVRHQEAGGKLRLKVPAPAPAPPPPLTIDTSRFLGSAGAIEAIELKGPHRRILNGLAWLRAMGVETPGNHMAAFAARYSPTSTSYLNPRADLAKWGLINAPHGENAITLTSAGAQHAEAVTAPASEGELHERVLAQLGPSDDSPRRRILEPLLKAYPRGLAVDDLAAAAKYSPTSTSFLNPRAELRVLGLIEWRKGGPVYAAAWLFPHSGHGGTGYRPMRIPA